jgi:2-(1,2-epoxy-1,2-dihydrophenyl)acetyl-CoA isomerase
VSGRGGSAGSAHAYDSPVTDEPSVLLHSDGAVATITLNRPAVLNSFSLEMIDSLVRVLRDVGSDPAFRAVVLTGAGRGFCAGAGLEGEIAQTEKGHPDLRSRLLDFYNPAVEAMRAMPKPVVAAVNGVAAGIGLGYALAADLILAAESASFLFAFSGIALSPDGGSVAHCAARIGLTRTAQLVLLGDKLSAKEALDWNLINAVHPDAELLGAAQAVAAKLAAGPTLAHAGAKEQLSAVVTDLAARLRREADIQQINGDGHDFSEGLAAFSEKRPPQFLGR